MEVKIDTKEKFHVITLMEPILSDKLAAALTETTTKYLQTPIKNIILKLPNTTAIDAPAAEELSITQQKFYEHNASFIICEVQKGVEKILDELELLEVLNITPTESEAWDVVQMEEIERELLDNEEDVEFNSHGEE